MWKSSATCFFFVIYNVVDVPDRVVDETLLTVVCPSRKTMREGANTVSMYLGSDRGRGGGRSLCFAAAVFLLPFFYPQFRVGADVPGEEPDVVHVEHAFAHEALGVVFAVYG